MKTLRALCAVVLFSVVGCGGGGSSPTTSDDFCKQYAKAVCGISSVCGITSASCEAYQKAQCSTKASAAVNTGKRVFAPGNMNNCLNKVKASYNGIAVIAPQAMADIELACNYVFQGTAPTTSGTCATQYECAGATDGSIICDAQLGVCAKKMMVAGGQACNGLGAVCPADYTCAPNTANVLICTAGAKVGESCATTVCDHTTRCVGGKCAVLAMSGEACTTNADCASTAPYCNPYLNSPPKCSAGLQFVGGLTSCSCVGQGIGCPTGTPATGTGGAGGGATGAAGSAGGAGGQSAGAAGSAGGAAGGAAGAAGGAGAGAAGTPGGGGAGGQGGAVSDTGA